MNITVCGAAGGEVTGSSYLVETSRARVLVDCGLFQGRSGTDARNRDLGPIEPARLDAIVLTHAHLDHCGRFGILAQRGVTCPIYMTSATVDFATLVLEDAARIQEGDAERENRHREREHRAPVTPLYTIDDVRKVTPLFRPVAYNAMTEIAPGISVRLVDAGHILGSASVEMKLKEAGSQERTIVFSADIGRWNTPILCDPTPLASADMVFLESTYGDRDHRSLEDTAREFQKIVHDSIWAREKTLIPAFAIGRTQQVLFYLAELFRTKTLPEVPVYLDSPMGISATELYLKHASYFDTQSGELAERRQFQKDLRSLQYLRTRDESRAINDTQEPCIIIAGGGMCEGGRIVHHLRHNVWRRGVSVIMVGFATTGSLGHALISGAPQVDIDGRWIPVRATVHTLGGFSGHGGQSELVRWFEPLAKTMPATYLTHGEHAQRSALAAKLKERLGLEARLPNIGDVIAL